MTLIDQIKQHIAESGSSQGKVAKEAGINAGALSAYLNENYKGNNEELEAKLIAYLERIEAKKREFVEAPSFIETKTANQIFGSLRFAQNTGVLAIIHGASGVGKTQAAREYRKRYANVWLVTASPSRSSLSEVLYEIALELGMNDAPRRKGTLARLIVRKMKGTAGLLIIDEADHLPYEALEELRLLQEEVVNESDIGAGVGLEGMISSAIAVIPEDSSVEIKDAAGKSASTDAFEKFLNFCKAEINIALLGQNQTTEQESNRASAQVGLEVMEDIRSDDQAMIEATFNTLLQWIVKYNFNVEQLPKFEFYEQEAINTDQVERDSKLHAMGVRFSKAYFEREYGFEAGDIEVQAVEKAEKSANTTEFSEGQRRTQVPMPVPILEQLEHEGEAMVDDWLQGVRDKLAQADSLEDFQSQLDSLIPELSFAEYGELLALGSTVAELAGRQSVNDEIKAKRNA